MKRAGEEQMIEDYLLGNLPEAELEHLDQLSVTDDDFATQLRAHENDLIDAYVKGELSSDVKDRFQLLYLASPRGREKIAFARTFHDKVRQKTTSTMEGSWRSSLSNFFAIPSASAQWGFAAASLLLLLIGGYLVLANIQLRNQIAQTQAEHRALIQQEQDLRSRLSRQPSSATEEELVRVQQQLRQAQQQLDETGQQDPTAVKLIALNLSPSTRGISKIPVIALPQKTDFIAMTLGLETNDFSTYQIALKDPGTDEILWRSDKMKIDETSNAILVGMPANILKPQNYLVELSGIPAKGASEIVGGYSFRVVTQ